MPRAHHLHAVGDEPTKRARHADAVKYGGIPLRLLLPRVHHADEHHEAWGRGGLEYAEEEAAGYELVVVLSEPRADRHGGPADDADGDRAVGAYGLDGDAPGDLEDTIGHEEESRDVVELGASQARVGFEAHDACVAWAWLDELGTNLGSHVAKMLLTQVGTV